MTEPTQVPLPSETGYRDRRLRLRRSIRDLELASGVNRGRLSYIERGITPSMAERVAIEVTLARWEAEAHG